MKKTIMQAIVVVCAISSFSQLHAAGVDSSGGGSAVVCMDSIGNISSAELLDLFEARNLYGLNIPNKDAVDVDQALEVSKLIGSGETMDGTVGPFLTSTIQRIHTIMRILPPGVGLTPIDDYHTVVLPKNCKIMQLARYELNEMISVDGDIWGKLNNTNRAALLVHEALYRYLRSVGETTSDPTRLAVGKAFGGVKFEGVRDGIPPNGTVECTDLPSSHSGQNRWWFVAYKNPNNGSVTLQFFMINGQLMLSKATGPLGADTWPFPNTKSFTFAYLSLVSVLDGGMPILLNIQREDNSTIRSFIDVSQDFISPKTELFCK